MASSLSEHLLLGDSSSPNEKAGGTLYTRDYWNDLPAHITSLIDSARAIRKSELAKIKTPAQAAGRASFVRTKVWELIGGPLEKTPLNVRAAGVIDRPAYRIEKLIFESQPEFYVPAHLYVPKSGTGPYPGIISPLGHTAEGKEFQAYQTLFQNLARMGYVVLTWDPPGQGERLQYPIPNTNRSRFNPTGEHDRFGWPALLIGSTTTQFEVWDSVRALDYLVSRPEVDAARIGCCGHSGGGTMTMFLCALEPRIQAAVSVEGHTENISNAHFEAPGAYADAEQNIIGSLKFGLDRGDLLQTFAPKPLLICFTHMDVGATYSPTYEEGTREIFGELQNIYGVYGDQSKVALSASSLPHDYDFFHRAATCAWFNKHLENRRADEQEVAFHEPSGTELKCTASGQILTSVDGRTAYQVNADRLRSIRSKVVQTKTTPNQLQDSLRQLLALPGEKSKQDVRTRTHWTGKLGALTVEEFDVFSEANVRVPGYFVKPSAVSTALPAVLIVSNAGKNHLFNEPSILAAASQLNVAICAIDTRGSGRAVPRFPSSGPSFYSHALDTAYSMISLTAGSPLLGQRVRDVISSVNYLCSRSDINASRIGILGNGNKGLEALFGAAIDPRLRAVLLSNVLTDLESLVISEDYNLDLASFVFGLLRQVDLPEVCAAVAPRPLWIMNPANPKGEGLALSDAQERYAATAKAYAEKAPDAFSIRVQSDSAADFTSWVQTALLTKS